MITVERLCLAEAAEPWQEVLAASCRRDVFQSLEWAGFEQAVNGCAASVLIVREQARIIGGQIMLQRPAFRLLRGFEAAGGPLHMAERGEQVCAAVAGYLRDETGPALYKWLRPQAPHQFAETLRGLGYRGSSLPTIMVDLSRPAEEVWQSLHGNARTGVKKGQKADLVVTESTSWEQWQAFDEVQRRHCGEKGTVPTPLRALEYFHAKLLPAGHCKLFLGILDGRCVSGMLFLVHRDAMLFYAGASDGRYLEASPNDPVMWEAMCWGCRNGIRQLDLYDTDPREESPLYGIHRFKAKWGGELIDRPFYVSGRSYLWVREQLRGNGVLRRVANALRARRLA